MKGKNRGVAAVKVSDEQRVAAAASGPERRIISLGAGTYAYVIDPVSSRIVHERVAGEGFFDLISRQAALSPDYAERLHRELSALSVGDFPAALSRLSAEGVFPAG